MKGLKYHRLEAGLTQTQVAQHLGISQSYYAKIEAGTTDIRGPHLLKLAALYKVSTDNLL